MGCNCTKKDKAISNYTDDGRGAYAELKGLRRVLRFFGNLALLLFCFSLLIILSPFVVLGLLVRAIFFKKDATFSIKKIIDLVKLTRKGQ